MTQINLDTLPRTRKEAQALGSKYYFTGKPCKHGHVTFRYTTGPCHGCVSTASEDSWASKNQSKRRESVRAYGQSQAGKERRAKWEEENVTHLRAYHAEWRSGNEQHKTRRRTYHRLWQRNKRQNDPRFKAIKSLRDRLNSALRSRRQLKNNSILLLVGCSKAELVAHLESQFEAGMSWDNYNWETWHIDHIKPVATFEDPEDPECWHYTNLRPRWAKENIAAGVRLRWDLAKKGASHS